MLFLVACSAPRVPDASPPDTRDLLDRYNARAVKVERIRARAVVEIRWTDEDGRDRYEQGDGLFLFRKPSDLALAIGKQVLDMWYWLGCDSERFWWFDMNPQDDKPNTAYHGRHEDLDRAGARADILIPPRHLIELLGVTPLPATAEQASIEPIRGSERAAVTFRIPVKFAGRLAFQQVTVGAITGRPLAIEFQDPERGLIARAELGGYKPLETPGQPLGAWPIVPTRIVITVPERKLELKINLGSITSDPERFTDAAFDYEKIKADRKPDKEVEFPPD